MKKIISRMIIFLFLISFTVSPVETVSAKSAPKLNKSSITINVGQKKTLKVKNTKKKVSWKSNKKSVATVTKKGVVQGKSAGTARITAKVSGKKLVCKVTVKAKSSKGANANAYAISFQTSDGGDFVAGISSMNISFQLDAKSTNVKAQILDVTDHVLYTKTFSSCKQNAVKTFSWNGKNNSGAYVGNTTCKVQITAGKTKTVSNQYFQVLAASSTGFAGGNGSAGNPYQVNTLAQLKKVGTSSTRCFVQTADIDAGYETLEAMGGSDVPFQGNYNGNNHVISNLIIKDGLFVAVGENGVISNLSFQGCSATKSKSIDVGLIASTNKGKIQNCIFKDCTANTGGEKNHVGIICGVQAGTGSILNCSVQKATVSASDHRSYLGGLAGTNNGKIISSNLNNITAMRIHYYGCYCGGITGYNTETGIISNCSVSEGKIQAYYNTTYNPDKGRSGGIAGYNDGQILTCTFTGTSEGNYQGAMAGQNNGIIIN